MLSSKNESERVHPHVRALIETRTLLQGMVDCSVRSNAHELTLRFVNVKK